MVFTFTYTLHHARIAPKVFSPFILSHCVRRSKEEDKDGKKEKSKLLLRVSQQQPLRVCVCVFRLVSAEERYYRINYQSMALSRHDSRSTTIRMGKVEWRNLGPRRKTIIFIERGLLLAL